MECKYESKVKAVAGNVENIYSRLSNFSRLGAAMPPQFAKDWVATETDCHFTIDKLGRVGLKIEDMQPYSVIKYGHDGSLPFDLNLWVQMKPMEDNNSCLKVTLKANLNPLVKLAIGSKLQDMVDKMAETMSKSSY
ncbi:MAG: hypothetical protein II951_01955 [Bacteroidales bacterium]|nr:hypothetical protein [Bacteroidales bacterium]